MTYRERFDGLPWRGRLVGAGLLSQIKPKNKRRPRRTRPGEPSAPRGRDARARPQVAGIPGRLELDRLRPTVGGWRGFAEGRSEGRFPGCNLLPRSS